jgi:hypothetical protein
MSARNAIRGSLVVWLLVAALSLPLGILQASPGPIGYSVDAEVSDRLWAIDLMSGVATPIGLTGTSDVEALSFSADGVLYGVDDYGDDLITCSVVTGACTVVGSLGVSIIDMGLAFDDSGNLWMSTDGPPPATFFSLNPANGAATSVGSQSQPVTGLGFGGGVLYGLGGDEIWNNLVTIDTSSGAATPVGSLGGGVIVADGGLDFDGNGVLWAIVDPGRRNPSQIFTINPATGAATFVATVVNSGGTPMRGFESLAIWPVEEEEPFVPEAGTMALLGSGLAGLTGYAALRWRQRD